MRPRCAFLPLICHEAVLSSVRVRHVVSTATALGTITDNAGLRRLYFDLLRCLEPTICCDIGANDGQAALLAREIVPNSEVYAFEANPEIYQLHSPRLSAAGVHSLNLALSDRSGEATVYAPRTLSTMWVAGDLVEASIAEPPDTGKTSLLRRNEVATYTEFRVPAKTLDDFFSTAERPIAKSRFALWIDVEGAAALVLAGAEQLLQSTAVIFIEVENRAFWKEQRTADYVCNFLRRRGFVPIARDREYGDDQFNVLFVHSAYKARVDALGPRSLYPESELPVYIPSFNNPTYLRRMIEQLASVGLRNVIVIDNGSEFPPHLELLHSLAHRVEVHRLNANPGPRHFFRDAAFYENLPQHFCMTDPDLEFNPELPPDFLEHLIELTSRHRVGKAGFALDISEPNKMIQEPFLIEGRHYRIWEWEAHFWKHPLETGVRDIPYRAWIDTTFAVYNKEFFRAEDYLDAIRVAGRYTARHLPWYAEHSVPADEAAFYGKTSKHSFYAGPPPNE